jgi:small nuclear ribonucleoprotein (snRNP)-like protein
MLHNKPYHMVERILKTRILMTTEVGEATAASTIRNQVEITTVNKNKMEAQSISVEDSYNLFLRNVQ